MFKKNKNFGFTLIELLLYVSVTVVMLLGLVGFVSVLTQSRQKNQAIAQVQNEGSMAAQIIGQTVRNAKSANIPEEGVLNVTDIADRQIVFEIIEKAIIMRENVISTSLTSGKVEVANLNFEIFSGDGVHNSVRFVFTLNYFNPEKRNEYESSKSFFGTATLR